MAGALAEAGQHEQAAAMAAQAEATARSITDPYGQPRTLAAVAEAGQHEQAAAWRPRPRRGPLHHRPVRAGAGAGGGGRALAEAGQHEQAAAVARSITNPDAQAQALAAVAKALAARGDTRQARHVASAACAVGRWTTVLGLVLSLEPSALRVLTDL